MFTHIVCAVDGSEHAARALGYATAIAQRDGAELHLAHVREKLLAGKVAGQDARLDEEQIDARIGSQMNALGAQYAIKPMLHVAAGTTGNAAQQIAEVADEVAADLIVIGTRGHSGLAGVILGSVTQRLLHIAHCPVLVVPPPHQAADSMDSVEAIATAN
jgi:nucleotide-binding universal stress UspA family protein